MTRKTIAVAVIVIISSIAPATAVIGFCAKMPCCKTAHSEHPSVTTEGDDCCATLSCYESPDHKLTTKTAAAPAVTPVAVISLSVTIVQSPQRTVRSHVDASPPPCVSDRLASLSILLI